MDSVVFTPAAVLDFLLHIDELSGMSIDMEESVDGSVVVRINDSTYSISSSNAVDVDVDEEVVDTVDSVNMEAYQDISEDESVEVDLGEEAPIQSGILKSLAKSLLLGGMIRLSSKLLN